jgi:hypothetical protein
MNIPERERFDLLHERRFPQENRIGEEARWQKNQRSSKPGFGVMILITVSLLVGVEISFLAGQNQKFTKQSTFRKVIVSNPKWEVKAEEASASQLTIASG